MTPIMVKIMIRILISDVFEGLTSSEREAIVAALSITAVGSDATEDAERLQVRRNMLDLPWAWEPDAGSEDGLLDRSALRLVRLGDQWAIATITAQLARELHDHRLGEQVYRLMLALVFSDGGRERDIEALEPMRLAVRVRPSRARELREELKDELFAMVA